MGVLRSLAAVGLVLIADAVWAEPLFREIRTAAIEEFAADGSPVVRRRTVRVSEAALSEGGEITLNLFEDVAPKLRLGRISTTNGAEAWAGGGVALSRVDGRLSGTARLEDGRFFVIRALAAGVSEVREVVDRRFHLGDDAVPAPSAAVAALEEEPPAHASTIDVLVAATPAAVAAAGGGAAIADKAYLAVAEANAGFAQSGAAVQLQLAGVEQVDLGPGESASGGFLNTATEHAGLRALRDRHGADVVSVWLEGPAANGGFIGLAWILQGQGAAFASNAYSVVEQNFVNGPAYGFAHELGHNLGCNHDRRHAGTPGAFPFSYGYQDPQGGFHTMMAYANGCAACTLVNAWSSPRRQINQRPAGVAQGRADAADNVATLNATRAVAAAWRAGVARQPPQAPRADPPTENRPPQAGAVTPSMSVGTTVSWTAFFADPDGEGDLAQAHLRVGSALESPHACWLRYDESKGRLQAVNTAATGFAPALEAARCRVHRWRAGWSDGVLVLGATVELMDEPAGYLGLWTLAIDAAGADSGWQRRAVWIVPGRWPDEPFQ